GAGARDAGGSGRAPGDRGRASCSGDPAARSRCPRRARAPGVGPERGGGGTRRHVHLTLGPRRRSRRGHDRDRACPRARSGAGDLPRALDRPHRDPRGARVRGLRARAPLDVIVRWGLRELADVLDEGEVRNPLLVASPRWFGEALPIPSAARWSEVPSVRIAEAAEQAGGGVVALGGGSAIDLGKAISAEANVPLVSVPTTYAGAEWTPYFGIR